MLDDGRLRWTTRVRSGRCERKNWMFYGSDTHAESAAAIFSVIASCRLHSLDPEQYLDEVLRVLPYWPKERMLELAPKGWQATRAKLRSDELDAPLCSFTIPRPEPRAPRHAFMPRYRWGPWIEYSPGLSDAAYTANTPNRTSAAGGRAPTRAGGADTGAACSAPRDETRQTLSDAVASCTSCLCGG